MRVFWDEWRSGRVFSVTRGFPALAVVLVLALAALGFHPGVYFEVSASALIFAGFWSGVQKWNQVPSWVWASEGVRPGAYVGGKVTGFAFVAGFWLLFLAPVGVLLGLLWAMPWSLVLWCAAWALAGGLAAQALARLGAWGSGWFSRVAAAFLVGGWLSLTWVASAWHRGNPLDQIARLQQQPAADPDVGALLLLLAVTALAWGAILLGLRRRT